MANKEKKATFTIIGNYLNLHNNKPTDNEAQNDQFKIDVKTGEVEIVH